MKGWGLDWEQPPLPGTPTAKAKKEKPAMQVATTGGLAVRQVHVTLSERNLRALLAKLSIPDSACTLVMETERVQVVITAERDGAHYAGRTPGPVTPETEDAMMQDIIQDAALRARA